ncbi:MAG: ribonuclease E inhibitor RraB, partial [Maribacter dokdonensis]
KEDKEWTYYTDFLYPSEEVQNYMADQSVLRSLEEAGDQLTKARRIDHWFYFSAEDEMIQCKNELIKAKFNVEHTNINKESSLPFELIVWRVDHVDIDTIYPITSNLRILAAKFGGEYDGWETMVVTE